MNTIPGRVIREYRKKLQLNQHDFAEKLGVSQGQREPRELAWGVDSGA